MSIKLRRAFAKHVAHRVDNVVLDVFDTIVAVIDALCSQGLDFGEPLL
jgi:hypothetical protein